MQIELDEEITASKLIKIRAYLKLTMSEMADVMGAPYGTYAEWENGRREKVATPAIQQFLRLLVDVRGTKIGKRFGV